MGYLGRTPTPSPIDASDIPANSIDASKIIDGAIAVADVADNAITEDKIADAAVVSLKSGRKNLIINGAMQVAQRGTAAVITSDSSNEGINNADRWYCNFGSNIGGAASTERVTSPAGLPEFPYSWKWSCTTTSTPTSTQFLNPSYAIEGYDTARLMYGSSNAKSVTISFWVYSSKVGNYGLGLRHYNGDGNRVAGHSFTINTANTWQKISLTFQGDTTKATNTGNITGLALWFGLAIGDDRIGVPAAGVWQNYSTDVFPNGTYSNFLDSTSNTFHITGVQLELGSVATDFEHRSYGEELALCQRYFVGYDYNGTGAHGYVCIFAGYDTDDAMGVLNLPVPMRTSPTLTYSGVFMRYAGGSSEVDGGTVVAYNYGDNRSVFALNYDNSTAAFSGHQGGAMLWGISGDSTANYIRLDAEL
jgi:hypothetical protein